jgi:cytochrome P450
MLEMLRTNAPLFRFELPQGGVMWFVTRFDDAVRVLKDLRFSSQMSAAMGGGSSQTDRLGLQKSMVFADEPDHTRLRALVSKGFTPRFIESLRPRIEEIANSLLDKVPDTGEMDLMAEFAYPLPINVISEMLGVPEADQDNIRDWSGALNDQMSTDPDRWAKVAAFATYVKALIEHKRTNPADDLISRLVAIGGDEDRLSEGELLGMVSLLIFAGHETTSNLIGNGMLALLTHPDQLARLQADPALIPNAIEELLRFCGPAVSTGPRVAMEDIEINGQLIRKGDAVNVVIGSADRDTALFTNPDDLDIARQIERHLAFGHGIHYCLGAPLARLEGQIAFSTLFKRLPNLRLNAAPETLAWRGNMVLRGLAALPVKFGN